ncbi:hypothetical protein MO867_10615 [Microbulbifer sp. OS29]|uniref:Lipoprotein SmpA/OmlA domain-containing protein n=1 Tax=Microbulbifer okhotskensis TaxID=2926617 RepID=A0A9X2EM60_9GAMM|nr:hypothetical protein [Microbulbifer okhotskensis]MCO1334792.1 hypothetical protein [Microbulbifer okhotskensis]
MFSRLRSGLTYLAGSMAILLALGAQATTIEVPASSPGGELTIEEVRGLKKDDVTSRLGDPLGIHGPIGEPAITRWEYSGFFVYFEQDTVLHTVKKPRG